MTHLLPTSVILTDQQSSGSLGPATPEKILFPDSYR
jgi:hypothetical protein